MLPLARCCAITIMVLAVVDSGQAWKAGLSAQPTQLQLVSPPSAESMVKSTMITAPQLIPYKTSSPDYAETERLKAQFARLRQARVPLYLTLEEFEKILCWKLGGQYGRQRERRKVNTDAVIRTVTTAALSLTHPDDEYETELRLGILCTLRGVGVPVASAILALVFPERYAVIDFRGWRQVFDEERTTFSIPDYKRYLREIRRLALELAWSVQEVDLAIWEYDRLRRKSAAGRAADHRRSSTQSAG